MFIALRRLRVFAEKQIKLCEEINNAQILTQMT